MDEELIAKTLPNGWFILSCSDCKATVLWTKEVVQQYEFFDEWFEMLDWVYDNIDHNMWNHREK